MAWAMAQTITELLEAAGIAYRRVRTSGAEGFVFTELPGEGVEGIRTGPGLFLIAMDRAAELAAAAVVGGEIVEWGTLRLGDRTVPVHRYTKPGEPGENLKRRAGWFQRRLK